MIEVYVAGAIIFVGLIGFFGPPLWFWAAMLSQLGGWVREDVATWFARIWKHIRR